MKWGWGFLKLPACRASSLACVPVKQTRPASSSHGRRTIAEQSSKHGRRAPRMAAGPGLQTLVKHPLQTSTAMGWGSSWLTGVAIRVCFMAAAAERAKPASEASLAALHSSEQRGQVEAVTHVAVLLRLSSTVGEHGWRQRLGRLGGEGVGRKEPRSKHGCNCGRSLEHDLFSHAISRSS